MCIAPPVVPDGAKRVRVGERLPSWVAWWEGDAITNVQQMERVNLVRYIPVCGVPPTVLLRRQLAPNMHQPPANFLVLGAFWPPLAQPKSQLPLF
jgi:hypothetical protein